MALALAFSTQSHAQTTPTPAVPVITGPPRVLILVYQQPGGADQVSITYDPKVSAAQVSADIDLLTQVTGWPISSRSITEAASPLTNRPGAMTSVVFAVPGVVQDTSHTFPVEALARAFHQYKRLNAVFIVGPQFQFQGARSYADNDIKVVLDQHDASYVYQIQILNQNFSRLPLASASANTHSSAGNGSRGLVVLWIISGILGAALLAGLLVYWLTSLYLFASRTGPKEKQKWNPEARPEDGTGSNTKSQQEVTTKR